MSRWARARLYAAVAAGAIGLLLGVGVSVFAQLDGVWSHLAWTGMVVVPLYALAVWLVHSRPDHPQARRLLLIAAVSALGVAVESVVRWVYRDAGDGAWLWYGNFLHQFLSMVGTVAGGVMLACYPDGTAEKPWHRRLVAGLWWCLSLPLLMLLTHRTMVVSPYLFEGRAPEPPPSPFTIEWLTPVGPVVEVLVASSAAAVVGATVLLVRYAQSEGAQRLRMRPLVYTIFIATPIFGAVALMLVMDVPADSPWFLLVSFLSFPVLLMFPVSIAISVLRYQVFDIDIALRRSAVYGVLVVVIAMVYVALTAAPGLALGNQVPVQLAVVLTVAAAVVFQPLRRRLEAIADRWAFGERANRYELLTSFGTTLEQAVDLDELLPRLADTVRRGLGASWVRVSLRGDQPGTWLSSPTGTSGTPTGGTALVEELRHHDEVVGRIECGARDDGYDEADKELLAVLAGQAATAIANVRLTARLGEQVAELERSRARIVAAQDDERRRIERDIHDGAQQAAVALLTKLRLARNQLARGESPEALLMETQADASELLTDLRELAHGIHPPVLTDGGLVAAVEARAGRLPLGVTVHADDLTRARRFGPEVEAAAYFVACEALTNVVKHAGATQAVVSMTVQDSVLRLQVRDDGAGLNGSGANGHGLTNLRDRIEALGGQLRIEGLAGRGTSLSAALPIGAPDA